MTQRLNSNSVAFGLIVILTAAVPFTFFTGPNSFILPRAVLIEIVSMLALAVFLLSPSEKKFPLMIPFTLFLTMYAFAAAFSSTPVLCTQTLFFFLCGAIICRTAAAGCDTEKQVGAVAAVIILAGAVMSVHGTFQFFRMDFSLLKSVSRSFRVFATAGTPAALSGWLSVCLCLAFGFMVGRGRAAVLIFVPLWMFFLAVIAMTFSRSGLIAAVAGMAATAALIFVRVPELRTRLITAAFACVLALVLGTAAAVSVRPGDPQMSLNPFAVKSQFYDSAFKSDSLRLRAFTLEAAFDIWKRSPLTGTGPGTFAFYYPDAQARLIRDRHIGDDFGRVLTKRQATHAHNEFAEIAVESGAIGFAAFLFLIISGLATAYRARGGVMMCAAAGGLIALLVQSLFEFTLHFPLTGFLFMALLGICCSTTMKRQTLESAKKRVRHAALVLPILGVIAAAAPFAASVYMMRGVSFARKGNMAAAHANLNRAASLDPSSTDIFMNRAAVRLSSGDLPRALADCNKSISLSHHPRIYLRRAYFYGISGRPDLAEQDIRAALAIDPWLPSAHFQLAQVLLARNRTSDAARELHRALQLDPGFEPARTLLRRISDGQILKTG